MLESEYFKGRYFKERRNVEARGIKLYHVVVPSINFVVSRRKFVG